MGSKTGTFSSSSALAAPVLAALGSRDVQGTSAFLSRSNAAGSGRTSKGPIRRGGFVSHKRRSVNECQHVMAGQSSNPSQGSKIEGQRTSASMVMLVSVPTSTAGQMPDLYLAVYGSALRQASVELRPQHFHLTLHLAKHRGISTSVLDHRLSLHKGAKRGPWRSMNSVHWYVKAALLKMLSKRTDAKRNAADQATKRIGDILLSRR